MSTAAPSPRTDYAVARAAERRSGALLWALPAAVVFLTATVLWLTFSVSLGEIGRYVLYELAFTAVPGVFAYRAFAGAGRLGLRDIALGWPLGYALELAAFALTAAIGARGLFWLYPPLVIVLSGAVLLRSRIRRAEVATQQAQADRDGGGLWGWGVAVVMVVLLVYAAERYFTVTPLPSELTAPVSYVQDYVWQMSLAAEALHHWPVTLPNAAGLDIHYHYFAYLHMAAVSQVTDLDLSVINFRLWLVPILILVPLQLVAMGRSLGAGSWAGVVAAALVLLVGPFDPWPRPPSEFFTSIYDSASYGFSLIFFIPLALLLAEQLQTGEGLGDPRRWVLVGVFAAAASGSKSTILPVCFLGVVIFGLATLWMNHARPARGRDLFGRVLLAGAVVGFFGLASRLILYQGARNDLEVHPLREVARLNPAAWINQELGLTGVPKALVVALAAILETGKLLAPLALGLWVVIRVRGGRLRPAELWVVCLLAASLLSYYTLFQPSYAQVWFLYYGYVAAGVAAGAGLVLLGRRYLSDVRPSVVAVAGACVLGLAIWATDGPPGAHDDFNTTPAFYRYLMDEVTWPQENSHLTPALYEGMRWIAKNTPEDAVLAVNNRWQDAAGYDPRFCYWTALAERRVMLECEYGTELNGKFAPFPAFQADPTTAGGALSERARLQYQMFYGPDAIARAAAREAVKRYGVSYAVLDLVHPFGATPEGVSRLGPVVFENEALIVARVASRAKAAVLPVDQLSPLSRRLAAG